MTTPNLFAAVTSATGAQLDANFAALGAVSVINGTVTGTNTIAFTPGATTPTIAAYANNQLFAFVAVASNTGAATLQVGSLAALSIYKDSPAGPIALTGGEIVLGNYVEMAYDSALNSNAGGFHLRAGGSGLPSALVSSGTSTVTIATGTTLTAAQMTGAGVNQAVLLRQGALGADFVDQTDTATALVGAFGGAAFLHAAWRLRVINTSGHTQTLTAGSGVNIASGPTTANGATHDFLGVVVGVSPASVVIYG